MSWNDILGRAYLGLFGLAIGTIMPASLILTGAPMPAGWGVFPALTTAVGYIIGWGLDWQY